MTKATKHEKATGSDLNKQSFVIQKGVSRSGRAIKPKTIFGETIIEIAKKTKNNENSVVKVVKPKVAKVQSKPVTKKSPAKKEVVKTAVLNSKPSSPIAKLSPKSSPTIPKGFTPVDIAAIISAKQIVVKPKSDAVVSPKPAKVNHVASPKSPPLQKQKQMTYEEREKEIKMLRARLKKLEAEQEAEKKARAKTTTNVKKVVKKVEKLPVAKNVSDERPARVKKPTWKAIEQD